MVVKQVWLITINNILLYLCIADDVCMCGNPVIMLDIFLNQCYMYKVVKVAHGNGSDNPVIIQIYAAITPASTVSNTVLPSLSRTHYIRTHTVCYHTHAHTHTHSLSVLCLFIYSYLFFFLFFLFLLIYIYKKLIQFLLEPVQKQITTSMPVYADFKW